MERTPDLGLFRCYMHVSLHFLHDLDIYMELYLRMEPLDLAWWCKFLFRAFVGLLQLRPDDWMG